MTESIEVFEEFFVSPEKLYKAWLDSNEHSCFTGSKAEVEPKIGGKFTAWDGYIEGKTKKLEPNKKIVQAWRTTDFAKEDKDSAIEIIFEKTKSGTKLTIKHTDIPQGQGKEYEQGWKEFYFEPMKKYFKGR